MAALNALSPNQVYLSREGKVFGPYSSEDLETFRRNGELAKYAWLWDGSSERWAPIHAEPPPPNPAGAPQGPVPARQPEPVPRPEIRNSQIIRAVCYDNQGLVGGVVESIDGQGASVYCASDFRDLGPFRPGQKLFINLVEETTGKSENIGAVVAECKRHERGLMYRFKWQASAPEMLAGA